jgi:cytosine/adenosine deaminase-related metal-dependent hydrolase
MPEGGQTLSALRQFIYPSFAALPEDDMHVYARHAAAEMIRFGTTLFEEPGCNHLDAVLEALAAAGVPMALGTDAENVSNHTDICRAMQLAALLPRDATRDPNAVTAEQALEMATLGGATALRMQDQVGSLEPGKQADIVVFDTANFDLRPLHNPVANIVYGSTGHSVDTVLLRHKQLTSLDEAGLRSQVEAINRRVLGEIGIAPLPRWPIV